MESILFGIQLGNIHLGNYYSLINCIRYAKENNMKLIILIADLHSLTNNQQYNYYNIENIYQIINYCIKDYKNVEIIKQSDIKFYLLNLFWNVSSIIKMNYLEKIYKTILYNYNNLSTFCYPVLMSVDIMCINPNYIYVGIDQKHNMEFYKKVTKNIKYYLSKSIYQFNIVKDIQNNNKMSKSDPRKAIFIVDSYEVLYKKIRNIKTSTNKYIFVEDLEKHDMESVKNLLIYISILCNNSYNSILQKYINNDFEYIKQDLLQHIVVLKEHINHMNTNIKKYSCEFYNKIKSNYFIINGLIDTFKQNFNRDNI